MERKGGTNGGEREGSGCPQEGSLQESEKQFGSQRAAGPSDGGLGEAGGGPWTLASSVRAEGEGGGRGRGAGVRAGHGPRPPAARKLGVSRGAGTWGRRPRSAASARPRPSPCGCEAFKDTSAPAQRGCVCVSVSACVLSVCRGVGAAAGGDPGRPHQPRSGPRPCGSHPCVFRPPRPRPGIFARPRPAPTLRRRHRRRRRRRRPGSHGPRRGQGGARHDVPPARHPTLRGEVCPPSGTLPTPAAPPRSAGTPLPQPQVAGGRSLRSVPRPGPPITPRPAPGGLPGPPPRRAEEGREPGGGAGGRVVPGCHFLPPPRSLRGARPPPPSPAPCGPRREPIIPGRGPRPPAPRPQAPGWAPGRGQGPEGGGGQAGAPAAAPSGAPPLRPAAEEAPRGIV